MTAPSPAVPGESEPIGECASCGEGDPLNECPKSRRPCGHHCNHIWTHDGCDWCGYEAGADDVDPRVEVIAAKVHEAWMETKRAQGVESRPSEWGEEQMVPYADLSERAKDLDRSTVKAVLDAMDSLEVSP